jgi:prepilin-type N-terminal cleavage/methylation domain-containing protein
VRSDARAPERGFTLLETVCTLIILGVLGSLVLSGFGTALSGYTRVREAGASYMQAELALIRLWKELAGAADFP